MSIALRRPLDRPRMRVAEFFAFEDSRPPEEKWELLFGQLVLMAGGTMRHSQICANLIGALHARLRGSACIVYTSDANVSSEAIDTSVYPDVVVRCGDALGPERTMRDPTAILEVASPSSEHRDAGAKLEAYTLIPSVQLYAIVRQDEWRMEVWRRASAEEWDKQVLKRAESVLDFPTLGVSVPLVEIYERVEGVEL